MINACNVNGDELRKNYMRLVSRERI